MEKQFQPEFGTRLREERERLGLTQEEFAAAAGFKRLTQYLYESEENVPNLRYLNAIEDLGVDLRYLIFGKRRKTGSLNLTHEMLLKIFTLVDELGRDKKGKPLPLKARQKLFGALCATYEEKDASELKAEVVKMMLAS